MGLTRGIIMGVLLAVIVLIATSSISPLFLLIPAVGLGLAVGKRPARIKR
jgi:hypothetical protein